MNKATFIKPPASNRPANDGNAARCRNVGHCARSRLSQVKALGSRAHGKPKHATARPGRGLAKAFAAPFLADEVLELRVERVALANHAVGLAVLDHRQVTDAALMHQDERLT